MHLIELLQKGQTGLVVFRAGFLEGGGRKEVGDRLIRIIDVYRGGLVLGGQEARSPVDDATRGQAADVGQHDEGWQVVGFTAQTVSNPRTHAGESGKDLPGIHHEITRAVQGRLALHRVNETHVVHASGELGQKITHPDAGLAMPAEFPETWLAISRFGGKELKFASGIKGRARPSFQFRFVVVGVDVAQSTRAEDLDDPLRPGREMGSG